MKVSCSPLPSGARVLLQYMPYNIGNGNLVYGPIAGVCCCERLKSIYSADGSTHTESNKLYRKVKHRYRPHLSPRQRPTAKARLDQAALAASAEARGATHRARPRSPSRGATRLYTHSHELPALTALSQHISHSHSGIDEKGPTENFVTI